MEFFNDVGSDPLKPSLFELVAQEQLRDLLQPALKYVLAVFAQRYPRYLLRIVNRHEEFYAAIMLFVERHYLRKHNASFSENFYGLKRRRRPFIDTERAKAAVGGIPAGETLRAQELWRSLIFLVRIHHLFGMAAENDYYEELGGGANLVVDDQPHRRVTRDPVSPAYPTNMRPVYKLSRVSRGDYSKPSTPGSTRLFELWLLVCNIAYLFGQTPFYRPWLSWIGIDLRRLGVEDFAALNKISLSWPRTPLAWIRRLIFASPQTLLDSLRLLLPTAIFFVKFLEWWYSPWFAGALILHLSSWAGGSSPTHASPHPQGIHFDVQSYGRCPICLDGLKNATALPSGYVFCYRCAYDHVEEHGKCPVTLLPTRFGKQIQAQQVPGWSAYYLDYKFLKKIISSLTAHRPASEAAALALDSSSPSAPSVLQNQTPIVLDEPINEFYLQKEAELKLRLETLLSKRRAAAMRGFPDTQDDTTQNNVEWTAVEEGFRHLERDLGKLQILKKFDKRSTSTTKELYLARQVDVQPVFNRQLISELSDTASAATDIFAQQIMNERVQQMGPFHDLENNLRKAVATSDAASITECIHYSDVLSQQGAGGKTNVTRILWNAIIEAPTDLANMIMASLSTPFDFQFIDDINGRTCLHETAIAGASRLAQICIEKGVDVGKIDSYGRTALHYAAMNGHAAICHRLLQTDLSPDIHDMDNYSALVYATLRGSVDCVRVLLDEGKVQTQPDPAAGDLIPLSLASQSGHVDVVTLLLQRGAHCLPNSNGEYPMHLAAREGHAEVCRLLLHHDGWDTPDKYHEWTPLFHAARYGRGDCVRILLDAGARVRATDELGHLAVYYAMWYGHHQCLSPLLTATPLIFSGTDSAKIPKDSPLSDVTMPESEIDLIPSLSLPPPIMPHRVYGHNYLDKNHLVQVTIGHMSGSTDQSGVRLHHRLISPAFRNDVVMASTPLKLVITTSRDVNSGPYSIPLPRKDAKGTYSFQIPSLDNLSLVFSIYPNFGTKTIGRAVALPSLFKNFEKTRPFVLPILDTRLHVIGEVDFEVNIVTPFDGVTLEVGGDVETYWKSLAMPLATVATSSNLIASSLGQASTISSLRGSYLYLVIQVTRDLHPVVCADWVLPQSSFDLNVSDVTLAQFEALALSTGRNVIAQTDDWPRLVSSVMVSLAQLLVLLPTTLGVSLELAYPQRAVRQSLGYRLQLNNFVDSQPNYPVFFASQCGKKQRLTSVGAAVEFARANNLLGIFVDADLLMQVPSLIDGIRNAGLLIGINGASEISEPLTSASVIEGTPVDAFVRDGMVFYVDHSMRELI
ncbi:cyclin-dependent protein kinase inhibitor [Mycena metata]|uniref:Peroxisome assembly protein 12 n=1 Tax=Mycena metata TaxID=1033252 RepID=A0AAD7KA82_9AGAR|nr:cyclin-dependent protein kinase inhibitor [Mycena metata]